MAFAIDIIHGHGLRYEMHRQLQLKKTEVRLCLLLIKQQKAFYVLHITSKTEHFSFKSGCVVQVMKCL